ncbi:serpin-ZX, partial [Tanacetum coccineum]
VATKILLDDANNEFKNGNFVCSPFSLETMLGMIAAGAKGQTLKQLLGFLGHETMDQLQSESPSLKMLANMNTDGGEAQYANFGNKPEQAVREINSWGNKETRGLIPTIIVDNELSQDAVIVLANALYFKGIWSTPFDANRTKRKDFHLINGETVSVPFMTSSSEFSYGSFEDFKILKIRYECEEQSNKFSMYIFLPERNDGLRDLLEVFHSNHALFHGAFDLNSRKLDEVWIPKFNISYNLEALKIIQKSFIQVDERGTEAASSTWADFDDYCERPPLPPANFVADHPFMFMIREDTSRAVFFVGVVLNPM